MIDNKDKFFDNLQHLKKFYSDFIEKGVSHFGSGWLWIIFNNEKLDIITTHDAIIPYKQKILGVIDLWEHAYYLKYQNDREKYLKKWLELINWDFVNETLESYK